MRRTVLFAAVIAVLTAIILPVLPARADLSFALTLHATFLYHMKLVPSLFDKRTFYYFHDGKEGIDNYGSAAGADVFQVQAVNDMATGTRSSSIRLWTSIQPPRSGHRNWHP